MSEVTQYTQLMTLKLQELRDRLKLWAATNVPNLSISKYTTKPSIAAVLSGIDKQLEIKGKPCNKTTSDIKNIDLTIKTEINTKDKITSGNKFNIDRKKLATSTKNSKDAYPVEELVVFCKQLGLTIGTRDVMMENITTALDTGKTDWLTNVVISNMNEIKDRQYYIDMLTKNQREKVVKIDALLKTQGTSSDLNGLCKSYYDICASLSVRSLQEIYMIDTIKMRVLPTSGHRRLMTTYDIPYIIYINVLGIMTHIDKTLITQDVYLAFCCNDDQFTVFESKLSPIYIEASRIVKSLIGFDLNNTVCFPIGMICLNQQAFEEYMNEQIMRYDELCVYGFFDCPGSVNSKIAAYRPYLDINLRICSNNKVPFDRCRHYIIATLSKMYPTINENKLLFAHLNTLLGKRSTEEGSKLMDLGLANVITQLSNVVESKQLITITDNKNIPVNTDIKSVIGNKCQCGYNNPDYAKFCCQCGKAVIQNIDNKVIDRKSVDKALQEIQLITGLNDKQVIDHITLRLNTDDSTMKYLNLATKKHVLKKTAESKPCVDAIQKICAAGDSKEQKIIIRAFGAIVEYFTIISQHLQSITKPDKRSDIEKSIEEIFNNQLEVNDSKRGTIPNAVRAQLFELSDGKCYCCGTMIVESYFEAGHIVPHKHGGESNINNLRAVCGKCNDDMGTMHMHEFMIDNKYRVKDIDTSYIEKVHNIENIFLNGNSISDVIKGDYHEKILLILGNHRKYYLTHRVQLMNILCKTLCL